MTQPASRGAVIAIAGAAALAGAAAYANALANGVTNFDDLWQVQSNPLLKIPPTLHSMSAMLVSSYHGEYQPVKLLSYLADHLLAGAFGADAVFVMHLVNVLLHAANCALVALISMAVVSDLGTDDIRRCGVGFVGAASGVLFALHPVHVESVAWLSSRKDVLSFFFMALSFLAFRAVAQSGRRGAGVLSIAFFALALGSKATVVCLPLLASLYWALAALRGGWRAAGTLAGLFAIAAVSIGINVHAAATHGYQAGPSGGSYYLHLLTVVKTFPFYMRVMLFPVGLSALYPTVAATGILDPAVWWGAAMIALQVGIVLFVRVKMVRFIVLWYLFSLLPVLQIIPMMAVPSAAADRYAYVPSLSFALAPAVMLWQVRAALAKRGSVAVPAALVAAAVVYAGVLGVATRSRNRVWRSSETLWRDVLAKNPNERFALVNLGQVYLDAGNLAGARELFNAAVRVDPGFIIAYANLGLSYEKSGNLTEARVFYETALGHGSSLTKRSTFEQRGRAAFGLAGIYFQERKFNSARHFASEAMLLFPEINGPRDLYARADGAIKTSKALADALIATGDVLADADFAKARDVYLRAHDEALEYPAPLVRLARLCQSYGLHREAVDAFARASELGQTGADFEYEYGVAALQSGDYEVASERLATAVAIDPGMGKARVKWAVARAYLGQPAQALEMLAGVLAADPGNAEARENFEAIKAFIEKKIGELPNAAK